MSSTAIIVIGAAAVGLYIYSNMRVNDSTGGDSLSIAEATPTGLTPEQNAVYKKVFGKIPKNYLEFYDMNGTANDAKRMALRQGMAALRGPVVPFGR